MAITRCPYCRAIIDEKDPYCSNCGTQLLFPEDAAAEEEIPGEKIIDVELEEKDYEIPEPGAKIGGDDVDAVDQAGVPDEADQIAAADDAEEYIALHEDVDDGGEGESDGAAGDEEVIVLDEGETESAAAPEESESGAAAVSDESAAAPGAPSAPAEPRERFGKRRRSRAKAGAVDTPAVTMTADPESGNGTAEKSRPGRKRGRPAKSSAGRRESVIVVDDAAAAEDPNAAVSPDAAVMTNPEAARDRRRSPGRKRVFGSTPMPLMRADSDRDADFGPDAAADPAAPAAPDAAVESMAGSIEAAPGSAADGPAPPVSIPFQNGDIGGDRTRAADFEAPADDPAVEAPADHAEPKASPPPGAPRPPGRDMTFDTRDLDRMGPTVDAGRDEIERFFKVLEDKEKESEGRRPGGVDLSDILPPWARGVKTTAAPGEDEEPAGSAVDAAVEPDSGSGPGAEGEDESRDFARREFRRRAEDRTEGEAFMNARTPPEAGTDELGRSLDDTGAGYDEPTDQSRGPNEPDDDTEAGADDGAFGRPRLHWPPKAPDSGVGLPEKLTQRDLPFDAAAAAEDEEDRDESFRGGRSARGRRQARERVSVREETEEDAAEETMPAGPLRLSAFLKGKLFDAVFVLGFWLTGVALTTRLLGVTVPSLLRTAGLPLAIFYAVLLLFYLFLFRFFLGETLGDRLFRDRPESEPRPPE